MVWLSISLAVPYWNESLCFFPVYSRTVCSGSYFESQIIQAFKVRKEFSTSNWDFSNRIGWLVKMNIFHSVLDISFDRGSFCLKAHTPYVTIYDTQLRRGTVYAMILRQKLRNTFKHDVLFNGLLLVTGRTLSILLPVIHVVFNAAYLPPLHQCYT